MRTPYIIIIILFVAAIAIFFSANKASKAMEVNNPGKKANEITLKFNKQ